MTIFALAKMCVRQRLGFDAVFQREDSDHVTVNSTSGSPYLLKQAAVPSAQLFAIRVLTEKKTVQVRLTSAVGTDQTFPVSGSMVWESPNVADAFTAIKIVTGGEDVDLEYFSAGN
jgi:hypothetical protein